jgi:hypothetical protein
MKETTNHCVQLNFDPVVHSFNPFLLIYLYISHKMTLSIRQRADLDPKGNGLILDDLPYLTIFSLVRHY